MKLWNCKVETMENNMAIIDNIITESLKKQFEKGGDLIKRHAEAWAKPKHGHEQAIKDMVIATAREWVEVTSSVDDIG